MEFIQTIYASLSNYSVAINTYLISEFVALGFGVMIFKKLGELKSFFWYLLLDLSLLILSIFIDSNQLIQLNIFKQLLGVMNACISGVELFIYYNFFNRRMIINKNVKFTIGAIIFPLIIIRLYFLISNSSSKISLFSETYFFSILIFIAILPFAISNLLNLAKLDENIKLHKEYSFWITVGIIYYSVISIPYYFLIGYFRISVIEDISMLEDALFYGPVIINIFCIITAFVCKNQVKS